MLCNQFRTNILAVVATPFQLHLLLRVPTQLRLEFCISCLNNIYLIVIHIAMDVMVVCRSLRNIYFT
jgi:hypothetical protein